MQRTVGSAKVSAEHDNRTVYMEKIPDDTTLVAVNAVSMVKPAALSEYINYNGGGSNSQGGSAAAVVFFKVYYTPSSYSLIYVPNMYH